MLTVISGPMYAGKSTALISKCISHVIAGQDVLAFSPSIDNRYDSKNIVTHDGRKFPSIKVKTDNPEDILLSWNKFSKEMLNIKVLAFDECQFFEPKMFIELVNYVLHELDGDIEVICAGLSQDSFGEPFGAMPHLLSIADSIVHLKAVCSVCKGINKATRTFRKTEGKDQIAVGGVESYEARCFKCWSV